MGKFTMTSQLVFSLAIMMNSMWVAVVLPIFFWCSRGERGTKWCGAKLGREGGLPNLLGTEHQFNVIFKQFYAIELNSYECIQR